MQPQTRQNPFARLLATLLLIAAGVFALFFGAVIIAVLIGIGVILFFILYLRAWWLGRKLGLNVHPHHPRGQQDDGITIEGEYTVEDSDQQKRDDQY
jgi:membrane protein implicated in regulation of membrane protease activity